MAEESTGRRRGRKPQGDPRLSTENAEKAEKFNQVNTDEVETGDPVTTNTADGNKPDVRTYEETSVEDVELYLKPRSIDLEKVETARDSSLEAEPASHKVDRLLERDADIDVDVDDDGVAQETVYQEIPLPGTDQISYRVVSVKGAKLN